MDGRMRIMILGSGPNQLLAIRRMQTQGHFVIACDYNIDSVGKQIADARALADVFSEQQVRRAALEQAADALVVIATDQPVLTAASVSQQLGLAYHLTPTEARLFTDKLAMKALFRTANLAQTDYCEVECCADLKECTSLLPAVVKPADSQGQRGVALVDDIEQLAKTIQLARSESRTDRVLIERYYPNREVTISGWVVDGICHILTLTDRVTFDETDKLGICLSHEHPSIHVVRYGKEIADLTATITALTGIKNGPIYYQFLVGDDGVMVNEIASRIGGAHEDVFIKQLTGFDILDAQIALTTGQPIDFSVLQDYDFLTNHKPLTVQLFFARTGRIAHIIEPKKHSWLLKFGLHYDIGDIIPKVESAAARCGYAVIFATTEDQLVARIAQFYKELKILDDAGDSLVIEGKRGYR